MASEQQSTVDPTSGEIPEDQSKPSFLNKVKAKARKLKSKIKHQDSAEESHDDPHGHADSPRSIGQDENESDVSESDDEGGNKYDIPYTPLSNAVHPQRPAGATAPRTEAFPAGALSSRLSADGSEDPTGTDNKSLSADPSVLKSEGPPGIEQAVPTNYSYFNSDPSLAKLPSDHDTSQRQRDIPSAIGGESAGLTSATEKFSGEIGNRFSGRDATLSKSGDKDSELPRDLLGSQTTQQNNDVGGVQPHSSLRSSLLSQPIEQDQGVRLSEPSPVSALTPHNSATEFPQLGGSNALKESVSKTAPTHESVTDRFGSDTSPLGEKIEGRTAGAEGAKDVMDTNWNTPSGEATWTQKAYGLKDSLASTLGYTGNSASHAKDSSASNLHSNGGEQKPIIDRVTETAYGFKDTVASKLGYADHAMSTDSTPVSRKATDSAVEGKDIAVNALGSADHNLSSDEKPVSAKANDATSQAKETVLQKTTPDHHDKGLADSISDSIIGLPSMLSSKLGLGGGTPKSSSTTGAAATQPGSGLKDGSDTVTAKTPTSNVPYDSSARRDTPYPDQQSASAPGLFDRVSGIASSLFSGGAKQPTTEGEKSSSVDSKSI